MDMGLGGLGELVMDREACMLQSMRSQSQTRLSYWNELNSLNFCLSRKLLISPSNLNESLAGCLWLSVLPLITWNIVCHSLLACRVSIEKSADNFMGFPLYVVCLFPLCFNNLSLSLIFVSFITMSLSVGLSCMGLCTSWTWFTIFFPMLGKFSVIISSNLEVVVLSLSLPLLGPPIMWILVFLKLSQRSRRLSSFLFILFSIFCFVALISPTLSSRSLIHSYPSAILLLIPSSVLSIFVCLLFSSSGLW